MSLGSRGWGHGRRPFRRSRELHAVGGPAAEVPGVRAKLTDGEARGACVVDVADADVVLLALIAEDGEHFVEAVGVPGDITINASYARVVRSELVVVTPLHGAERLDSRYRCPPRRPAVREPTAPATRRAYYTLCRG